MKTVGLSTGRAEPGLAKFGGRPISAALGTAAGRGFTRRPADPNAPPARSVYSLTVTTLTAQRRLEFGLALLASGDAAGAADAFRAVLELDPIYPEAHFSLGEALEQAGERDPAVQAYRDYLATAKDDELGALARLVLLGAAPQPDRLPVGYVRRLFDQYATRFDQALTQRLGYRVPLLLRGLFDSVQHSVPTPLDIIDIGCGTGLSGAAFRDLATHLAGVDLSPAMLAKARDRGFYAELEAGDLVDALRSRPARWHLIVAADVLIYFGDLAPCFAAARAALRPGGSFLFSLEAATAPMPGGYRLSAAQRFQHDPAYVNAVAVEQGFTVVRQIEDDLRLEGGQAVRGRLYLIRTTAAFAGAFRPAKPSRGPGERNEPEAHR